MNLIRATNFWNCTLAAAAMVMDCSLQGLEKLIGHDGSEIINPTLNPPLNRKGFHMQEIIDAAFKIGYSLTPVEASPVQTATGHDRYTIFRGTAAKKRLNDYLINFRGIIVGPKPNNVWHAVAWDGLNVYDPIGKIYPLDDIKINIKLFWAAIEYKIN